MTDLLRCALPAQPDPALADAIAWPKLHGAAVQALAEARKRPSHAAGILSKWFRKARWLGSKERPIVQEAVYGVIRHESFLNRAGAWEDTERVEVWGKLVGGDRFEDMQPLSPAEDYASALSLGYRVAKEWLDRLGADEAAALGAAMAARAPLTLRANRLKVTREALAARLEDEGVTTHPTERAPDGLHVVGRVNLQGLGSFRDGWFEVQDEASQLLVNAVPINKGDRVLDLCAGAGGKALGLAARRANVTAYDIRDSALRELVKRANRAGAPIAIDTPAPAPVVLVDAPCSGTGRLRRDPALRWGLEAGAKVDAQAEILSGAAELVEPGGALVYATCSLLAEENDHPAPGPDFVEEDRQWLWPQREGTDGFFWVTWRRGG
jgi:16S rRNA (cytosine967-C5)-methyltransferase